MKVHVHYSGKCNDVDTFAATLVFYPVLTGIKEQFTSATGQVCRNWIEIAEHCIDSNLTFPTLQLPCF